MHIAPSASTSRQSLNTLRDRADSGGVLQAEGEDDSLPFIETQNTSQHARRAAPPCLQAAHSPIRKESFCREFTKAIPALLRFDRHAAAAYESHAFSALYLRDKMDEYDCLARQLMTNISNFENGAETPCQRDILNRLISATYALIDAFPEWNQRSTSSSPTLKDFLQTLSCTRSPLSDVQKHLGKFTVWLENQRTTLSVLQDRYA